MSSLLDVNDYDDDDDDDYDDGSNSITLVSFQGSKLKNPQVAFWRPTGET